MSLTFPAAYSAKLHSSSIDVDWLFHLVNDNAGVVYLASKDRTVGSNRYYGIVEDSGEITRELDLINCVASIGEISISCIDKYKTDTLSAELLHNGADYYINQQILIYECVNDETTLANCPLLYEGRLKEIDMSGNSCVLIIEQLTPFDHIKVPQSKDTAKGLYVPLVYGNYTNNASGTECTSKNLFPCPTTSVVGNFLLAIAHKSVGSGLVVHYYDRNLNQFHPITSASTATFSFAGLNQFNAPIAMERSFVYHPNKEDDTNDFTNPEFSWDVSAGTQATMALDTAGVSQGDFRVNFPIPSLGYASAFLIECNAQATVSSSSGATGAISLIDQTYGRSESIVTRSAGDGNGTTENTTYSEDIQANYAAASNQIPSYIDFDGAAAAGGGDAIAGSVGVRDIKFDATYEMDITNLNYDKVTEEISKINMLYLGADGLDQGYTDGSGTAREPHQIHRDLMDRFAGVDYDNDYMKNWNAGAPGDYDLDTARDSWEMRVWELEPVFLKDMLEKIQFEGCFIFVLSADSDGSGNAGGRYIWVQDSYSAGDVVQTLDESDYINLSIGHTDVFEIITKSVYDFDRSPVNNSYRQQDEYDNTTDRDNWNLGTDHLEHINLDYLVGSKNGTDAIYDGGASDDTPNESIVLYRDNIQSEPKILVDCEIVNKKKMNIEYGDIVQFNDSNINPYGETWSNLYFMVISERRSKMGVSITAREVYRT